MVGAIGVGRVGKDDRIKGSNWGLMCLEQPPPITIATPLHPTHTLTGRHAPVSHLDVPVRLVAQVDVDGVVGNALVGQGQPAGHGMAPLHSFTVSIDAWVVYVTLTIVQSCS